MAINIFSRPVELIKIDYESSLTDLIMDLEHLRRRRYEGTTPVTMFLELKALFHLLESLGSARLEGNRTAIADIVEENINPTKGSLNEQQQEVRNIEDALQYIDEYIRTGNPISEVFLREIHKRIVKGLTLPPEGEGDPTPGKYRQSSVIITNSELDPPGSGSLVSSHMGALVEFIQTSTAPKHDLLKTAIVHHRFTAIHPFNNGNGRTVRALTYAMLLYQEFSVAAVNRILNPTAIFCNDRATYIKNLVIADKGTDEDLTIWCEYVINGLKVEIEKVNSLTDYNYVKKNILLPAIKDAAERKSISEEQAQILVIAVQKRVPIMSKDIVKAFPSHTNLKRSRLLSKMVALKLLKPIEPSSRKYVVSFSNSYLLRGVVEQLEVLGFIPNSVSQK